MGWKDEIGDCFSRNDHHRLYHLNNLLNDWCKEWTTYIREFDGMSAEIERKTVEHENRNLECKLIKATDVKRGRWPFKAYITYFSNLEGKLCLLLLTTRSFNFEPLVFMKKGAMDADEKYFWHDETEIKDLEIVEKDYILQLLTNRYIDYLDNYQS